MSTKTQRSLISLLLERIFNQTDDERVETFDSWFTYDEIDWFRDNADLRRLEPLFTRYQRKMEESIEAVAREIGLTSHDEIFRRLQEETAGREGQWRLLDRMLSVIDDREEFFVMMQTLAEKRFKSGDSISARELEDFLFDFDDGDNEVSTGGKSDEGKSPSSRRK